MVEGFESPVDPFPFAFAKELNSRWLRLGFCMIRRSGSWLLLIPKCCLLVGECWVVFW